MNNSSGNWGLEENFLPFSSSEGSVVQYSATYTMADGSTWDATAFDRHFSYSMNGVIELAAVPEPGTFLLIALGLGIIGKSRGGYRSTTI
jgi:hypothetical protein